MPSYVHVSLCDYIGLAVVHKVQYRWRLWASFEVAVNFKTTPHLRLRRPRIHVQAELLSQTFNDHSVIFFVEPLWELRRLFGIFGGHKRECVHILLGFVLGLLARQKDKEEKNRKIYWSHVFLVWETVCVVPIVVIVVVYGVMCVRDRMRKVCLVMQVRCTSKEEILRIPTYPIIFANRSDGQFDELSAVLGQLSEADACLHQGVW